MSTTAPESVPALFNHCLAVYETMFKKAKLVEDGSGDKSIDPLCVYEGRLTELITVELYLSTPYYTKITRALKEMGCIRQLRRGGGSAPSQWELVKTPTLEMFNALEEGTPTTKWADKTEFAMLEQRVRDLMGQMADLEEKIQVLIDYIGKDENDG